MNIRQGNKEDHETIFMMGYDAWGEGLPEADYLRQCMSSPKYPQGTWYVLEDASGLVSSLIVYRTGFDLPADCWGIGSVATPPALRKKGYAGKLLQHVIDMAAEESIRGIYLFSGIDPDYYARFGFIPVPAAPADLPGLCMVLSFRDADQLKGVFPTFF